MTTPQDAIWGLIDGHCGLHFANRVSGWSFTQNPPFDRYPYERAARVLCGTPVSESKAVYLSQTGRAHQATAGASGWSSQYSARRFRVRQEGLTRGCSRRDLDCKFLAFKESGPYRQIHRLA